jgi:hypothetical protein
MTFQCRKTQIEAKQCFSKLLHIHVGKFANAGRFQLKYTANIKKEYSKMKATLRDLTIYLSFSGQITYLAVLLRLR